jgi:putative DNA-invertase from lambdoid prophage Rac
VSTAELTVENQSQEISAAGFAVEPQRIVSETISGSSAAAQRPQFQRLLDRLEQGDVLVLTKLDRLGRNAVDVIQTIERLAKSGVRVHCLQLGGADLTSPAGKFTLTVLAAVAQFERDLIIERTKAGLARAVAKGKRPGRKPIFNAEQKAAIKAALESGTSVSALARQYETTRTTINRVRSAA